MFFRFLLHRFRVFLHDFCIFSHFFVKFSACANANWQISGVITSIISELAKVQSPNKNGKFFAICKTFACSFKAFALTGRQVCYPQKPRAMPWAKSFCPFRACCLYEPFGRAAYMGFLAFRACCLYEPFGRAAYMGFWPFRACCLYELRGPFRACGIYLRNLLDHDLIRLAASLHNVQTLLQTMGATTTCIVVFGVGITAACGRYYWPPV